jgi:molybdate transport system permease protein
MNGKRISILFYSVVLSIIALPLLSLIVSIGTFPLSFSDNDVLLKALMVSGKTSFVTMVVVLLIGTPAAYINTRTSFKGKKILDLFLDLPLVLPPAVAGLLLLMTFGKRGFIGAGLYQMGWQIPFSMTAVVIAQLFVALPIYIKTVAEGFNRVDPALERTAMTLGDSKLQAILRVTLPLAKGSILTGGIMAWARGLAEFGATMMFAGNLPSVTQTLPLAIYSAMETDLSAALNIARLMVVIALSVLVITYKLSQKGADHAKG